MSARLPGRQKVGGLWPAIWLMGNLARATYVASSENMWPWSFDVCDRELQTGQVLSACNRAGHYGMRPGQGRGAAEIDVMEGMPGDQKLYNTKVNRPYFSTSLQISPAMPQPRPYEGSPPIGTNWYKHGVSYGENVSMNIFFYGVKLNRRDGNRDRSYQADAISANTPLEKTHFDDFHTYRLEWEPGKDGFVRWCVLFVHRLMRLYGDEDVDDHKNGE